MAAEALVPGEKLMTADRIEALRQALAAADNAPLRLMLAELLAAAGRSEEACVEYTILLDANQLTGAQALVAGDQALLTGNLPLAARLIDVARRSGVVEGVTTLQQRYDQQLSASPTMPRLVRDGPPANDLERNREFLETSKQVTFADIGGLEEVKKVVNRMIILPVQRPELYRTYKRQIGGGVLLYGPPGCGKTMLARATAAECDLPFINVRIENILDPYIGNSERNLHGAFEFARQQAPCVIFLDEIDALAFARRKHQGSHSRALVDQLLQEMDSIGSENQQLLILGATNAPWDVDDALLRPGRFDRRIFVPPPDEPARLSILQTKLAGIPHDRLDMAKLARTTPLFSGADLSALIDRATDGVIDEALETGGNPPMRMQHLETARTNLRPTTLEWLERAKNYVEFANQDDRYREVAEFLKSREARSWKNP